MAVPKRKTSKSKRDMSQAGKGLSRKSNIRIDENGSILLSHNTRIVRVKKDKQEKSNEETNNI